MQEITKKFYENKLEIKWIYYTYVLILLGMVCYVYMRPGDFRAWICVLWFLIQVIGAKKSLKQKTPYIEISSEYIKIENKKFCWDNIQSISVISPLSHKFNTLFRIELKTTEKDFTMGVLTDKDRLDMFNEIEKYKKIKFVRYDRYATHRYTGKSSFCIMLILALLVVCSPLVIWIFTYLFSFYHF